MPAIQMQACFLEFTMDSKALVITAISVLMLVALIAFMSSATWMILHIFAYFPS